MNSSDPLEKRLISDLPRQLDRAVRPFDAAAIAREAGANGRPSILRITTAVAVLAIGAVVAIVAVEGLSGSRSLPGSPDDGSPSPTPAASSAVGLDQLASIQRADRIINTTLTAEEHVLLTDAHGTLIQACMQERGWDYHFLPATPEDVGVGPDVMSEMEVWMFSDVASAESVGYGLETHLREVAAWVARMQAREAEVEVLDPDTMSAEDAARFYLDFWGTDEERVEITERDGAGAGMAGGGCLGDAQRTLYGDIAQEMWLRDARGTAQSDIYEATLSDQAVADALAAWRDCVRDQEFQLNDPKHAWDVAVDAAQAGDFERERLIATTDAQCKVETRLDLAVQAAFLSATIQVLPELEADLLALQQLEEEAVARAKDILLDD